MKRSDRNTLIATASALAILAATQILAFVWDALEGDPLHFPLTSLLLQTIFALLALAGASFSDRSPGARLGFTKGRLTGWRVATLMLGTIALSHALDSAIHLAGLGDTGALGDFTAATQDLHGIPLMAALLGLGIAPAFGEEMLFRGMIQRGLLPRIGAKRALLVASLVFGAVHLDPVQSPAAFILGLYLGLVALWAQSLWPAILCHAGNNLLAVGFTASGTAVAQQSWHIPLGLGAAALALFFAKPRPASVFHYSAPPVEPTD